MYICFDFNNNSVKFDLFECENMECKKLTKNENFIIVPENNIINTLYFHYPYDVISKQNLYKFFKENELYKYDQNEYTFYVYDSESGEEDIFLFYYEDDIEDCLCFLYNDNNFNTDTSNELEFDKKIHNKHLDGENGNIGTNTEGRIGISSTNVSNVIPGPYDWRNPN